MNRLFFRILVVTLILAIGTNVTMAQSGDQILDGIGETGMIARYVFDGNAKDWSRNNLHAEIHGKTSFVEDKQFGKVLSLSGENNSFISLPEDALKDLESVSITGWVLLRSKESGQFVFDFGRDNKDHFFAAPFGTKEKKEYQTELTSLKAVNTSSSTIELNKWVHFAIVVDVPSGKMITYVDSKPIGESENLNFDLTELFNQQTGYNQLFIGKSIVPGGKYLNALVHDFRIYRVPLNPRQVARIYYRNRRGVNAGVVNTDRRRAADNLPKFPDEEAQLYNTWLVSVSDVEVTTGIGNLPRLPSHVPGVYQNGMKGPEVRVIWPADTSNAAVKKEGSYIITGRVAGTNFHPKATVTVKDLDRQASPALKLAMFTLDKVSLNNDADGHPSKFIENRDKFFNTLAGTDPNSFLYMFRHAFGLSQPEGTKPLGVWDSKETKLRGHATGHYLSAIAQAYLGTGYDETLQTNFMDKMNYMVNTLYDLSQMSGQPKEPGGEFVADPTQVPVGSGKEEYDSDLSDEGIRHDYWNWGKGFISAYPPDQFIMLEKGAKYGGQKNQIWAPYYTLHKIMAGLMDVYEATGNKKALDIATGMGDWVYARLRQVPTDTLIKMWNTYIAGEYGGMNDAMARLFVLTNNEDYRQTAKLFDNIRVFFGDKEHTGGLAKNVDLFRGLHANQHIPQIVGSMETYLATDNPDYFKIADNFWYEVVNNYSYSIGGVAGARNPANAECFIGEPGTLYENGFSAGGQNETCATYNMLKLTDNLFLYSQRAELMDYYERALYNHILASVAEDNPGNTYHVPLRPGSIKQFGNPNMTGFTCCNGTALESSTKLQNSIYFRSVDNSALYVNLYIPSTLHWDERNVWIDQITNYPNDDNTKLVIHGEGDFDIFVRVPGWATKGFFVTINGQDQQVNANPGSYLKLSRDWKDSDEIELRMPFQFHLNPVMDQQNIASLFYGPVLLAAQESGPRSDWRKITLDADNIGSTIKGDPHTLEFTVGDAVFKPFFDTYGRHSVYVDVTLVEE